MYVFQCRMLVVQSLKNQNPIQSEPRADPDAFIGL